MDGAERVLEAIPYLGVSIAATRQELAARAKRGEVKIESLSAAVCEFQLFVGCQESRKLSESIR